MVQIGKNGNGMVITYERIIATLATIALLCYSLDDLLRYNTNDEILISTEKGGPMWYVANNEKRTFHPVSIPTHTPPKIEKDDLIYSTSKNTVPIVNEEFKVIFFQVAKAASSEWMRFFSRLSNSPNWCYDGSIHDDKINGLKRLSDYDRKTAGEMMTDPSWTKAMFVRNPKARILSAYLDKAVDHSNKFQQQQCRSYERFGGNYDDCVKYHTNFDFFIHEIVTTWDNVHWVPIYERIDEKWWPYMTYISNMENLGDDVERFLKSIYSNVNGESAWDRIGKTGWSDNVRDCDRVGNQAFLAVKDKDHKTNADEKMKMYYTPELERFIEQYFWKDYSNPYFHFSPKKIFPDDAHDPGVERR